MDNKMNTAVPASMNHRMEVIIGALLRAGVVFSGSVVFLGGLVYLSRHGLETVDYRVFQGEPEGLCHVGGIAKNALALHGRGLIQLGLLFLIATPLARVALSLFAFAYQRDKLYVAVTLFVLGVLIYSLLYR